MFDLKRLSPVRVFPAIKRRVREVPHYIAWNYSGMGKQNNSFLQSCKKFNDISLIETDDVNINFLKNYLNFKKLAIDIRYDRGITKEETLLLSSNDISIGNIDQRPNLLIVGLSYTF